VGIIATMYNDFHIRTFYVKGNF